MQIAEKIIDWAWLNHLEQIARQAGEAIMGVYAKDFAHWNKADASPVTEADLLADRLIRAALAATFPDIPVVSEEFEHSIDPNTNTFFLVDPLDGTKEFLKRNGEFTVNIALIHDGHPVAAVVGAVRRDSLGEKQLVVKDRSADMPLRVIGSRSHAAAEMGAWLQQLSQPYLFMAAGSSLKFCRIAEGEADVYPRFGPTSQWDTAAGQCVLEAAGGTVSTLDGAPLCYGLDRPMLNPQFVARGG
jgi:3'(2'), 5'-bisphosphate nucleotidase